MTNHDEPEQGFHTLMESMHSDYGPDAYTCPDCVSVVTQVHGRYAVIRHDLACPVLRGVTSGDN